MTIKTLIYIHDLLKEEERRTREVYKRAADHRDDLEYDENATRDQIQEAAERASECCTQHSEALGALLEFERKEWQ